MKHATKNKSTAKKSSSGSDPKSKRIVQNKMQRTMHEFKHHELDRGPGGKVTDPKQAIAIGLSEARRSGADIPPSPNQKEERKKTMATKTATKKTATKKVAVKKTAPKKAAVKKAAPAKKTVAKKAVKKAVKKAPAKKR